jgi:hypothetical protein
MSPRAIYGPIFMYGLRGRPWKPGVSDRSLLSRQKRVAGKYFTCPSQKATFIPSLCRWMDRLVGVVAKFVVHALPNATSGAFGSG